LSVLAVALVAILVPSHSALFLPYFGGLHPLLVMGIVVALGAVLLPLLQSRGGFQVLKAETGLRPMALAAGLATLFAIEVVLADTFIRYPEDMNAALPQALLFYPAIAFVVEIIFHVTPLAILLAAMSPVLDRLGADRLAWIVILLTALLEPTFQLGFQEEPFSWAGLYTWVHLLALNLVQLWLFRRHDFITMYAFRFSYYIYWHIVWGYLRLSILF
jgi:hypothetical protein